MSQHDDDDVTARKEQKVCQSSKQGFWREENYEIKYSKQIKIITSSKTH